MSHRLAITNGSLTKAASDAAENKWSASDAADKLKVTHRIEPDEGGLGRRREQRSLEYDSCHIDREMT